MRKKFSSEAILNAKMLVTNIVSYHYVDNDTLDYLQLNKLTSQGLMSTTATKNIKDCPFQTKRPLKELLITRIAENVSKIESEKRYKEQWNLYKCVFGAFTSDDSYKKTITTLESVLKSLSIL